MTTCPSPPGPYCRGLVGPKTAATGVPIVADRCIIDVSLQFVNVSVSISHYTVFDREPKITATTGNDGPFFFTNWFVTARTIDGRKLTFDPENGRLLPQ